MRVLEKRELNRGHKKIVNHLQKPENEEKAQSLQTEKASQVGS